MKYLAESAVRVKTLEEKLRGAELENRYLRELLRLARIEKYGPGSEETEARINRKYRNSLRSF